MVSDPLPRDFVEAFDALREPLGPFGQRHIFFDTIGSTNDIVAALSAEGADEGVVVIADAQTAGRGRRGRTWFSPPGAGLYVSVLLAPGRAATEPVRATSLLTLAAGVALAEGIEGATGLSADIKWPNDLRVGTRKLAGILAEGAAVPGPPTALRVVLGFGINVGPAAYPPDLAARATSLESELGRPVDRALVCVHALASLAARYGDLMTGRFDAILDHWRRRAPGHVGARVRWQDGGEPRSGVTAGIDDTGALLVHVGASLRRVIAGEVIWE
ncbi:MAG: biotin--[acetyl-CoA-carboxylase] ligase [Acidimicrobiia bacterium]|nr:biotin--[acetyl-CoA-carboxylase] ligase [Acidimicrobiia bacterium]